MNVTTGYVGIDVAKRFHKVCVKDQHKKSLIPTLDIEDTQDGYDKLRRCFDSLKEKHQIEIFTVGLESTGTYHEHLVEWCRQQPDVTVSVINPVQTSHYMKSELKRASTDKISAEMLAQFMVEKTPRPTQFVADDYESVKRLVTHLHALTKQKTAAINRLREQVALLWPEYEQFFKNFSGKQCIALLTVVQTPTGFMAQDKEQLKHVSVLGTSYTLRKDFLAEVTVMAQKSQPRRARVKTEPIIKSLAEQILLLLEQIDQITDEMRALFTNAISTKNNDSKQQSGTAGKPLLATIDGVGEVSAMFFTAAIGDPNRFARGKQVCAYFGLTPRVHDSGETVHGRGYILKKGSSVARYYLFNCTLAMIRKVNHPIAKFYQRLVAKGKPKLVAITACMRKLILIMFAMLRSNMPFNPSIVH
jgi:transposase